jgi:hypothetical protein
MKATKIINLTILLAGFGALATPRSYGQSEVHPDHFDSPSTEPFPQPKTKEGVAAHAERVHFVGNFKLPYSLRCAGKRLLPGRYAISLRSDGKTGRATLTQKGQTLEIAGLVRPPAEAHARNIILVECMGKAHRLAAIHVEEMELVFAVDPQLEPTSHDKPRRTEKLLLTRASAQK